MRLTKKAILAIVAIILAIPIVYFINQLTPSLTGRVASTSQVENEIKSLYTFGPRNQYLAVSTRITQHNTDEISPGPIYVGKNYLSFMEGSERRKGLVVYNLEEKEMNPTKYWLLDGLKEKEVSSYLGLVRYKGKDAFLLSMEGLSKEPTYVYYIFDLETERLSQITQDEALVLEHAPGSVHSNEDQDTFLSQANRYSDLGTYLLDKNINFYHYQPSDYETEMADNNLFEEHPEIERIINEEDGAVHVRYGGTKTPYPEPPKLVKPELPQPPVMAEKSTEDYFTEGQLYYTPSYSFFHLSPVIGFLSQLADGVIDIFQDIEYRFLEFEFKNASINYQKELDQYEKNIIKNQKNHEKALEIHEQKIAKIDSEPYYDGEEYFHDFLHWVAEPGRDKVAIRFQDADLNYTIPVGTYSDYLNWKATYMQDVLDARLNQ